MAQTEGAQVSRKRRLGGAGRNRVGTLIWRKKGWVGRVTVSPGVRQCIDLNTRNIDDARRKLKRIVGNFQAPSAKPWNRAFAQAMSDAWTLSQNEPVSDSPHCLTYLVRLLHADRLCASCGESFTPNAWNHYLCSSCPTMSHVSNLEMLPVYKELMLLNRTIGENNGQLENSKRSHGCCS